MFVRFVYRFHFTDTENGNYYFFEKLAILFRLDKKLKPLSIFTFQTEIFSDSILQINNIARDILKGHIKSSFLVLLHEKKKKLESMDFG